MTEKAEKIRIRLFRKFRVQRISSSCLATAMAADFYRLVENHKSRENQPAASWQIFRKRSTVHPGNIGMEL